MAKKKELSRAELQHFAFDRLKAIADDPEMSGGVKVQALTQIARLADQLKADADAKDSLAAMMDDLMED